MNLTNRCSLRRPKHLVACMIIMGLFGVFILLGALIMKQGSDDDWFFVMLPVLMTIIVYAHYRYPTKIGWLIISAGFALPAIFSTTERLPAVDIAVWLAIGALIYCAVVDNSVRTSSKRPA